LWTYFAKMESRVVRALVGVVAVSVVVVVVAFWVSG
jgi:hypothetical protein